MLRWLLRSKYRVELNGARKTQARAGSGRVCEGQHMTVWVFCKRSTTTTCRTCPVSHSFDGLERTEWVREAHRDTQVHHMVVA